MNFTSTRSIFVKIGVLLISGLLIGVIVLSLPLQSTSAQEEETPTPTLSPNPYVVSIAFDDTFPPDDYMTRVVFKVTFSEWVRGVDVSDFSLSTTGTITGAYILEVDPDPEYFENFSVIVYTGSGLGSIRLDLNAEEAEIEGFSGYFVDTGFTNGEALEIQRFPLSSWIVTKTEDTYDGVCDSDCSLREAIAAARAAAGTDGNFGAAIEFNLNYPAVISLQNHIDLWNTIVVDGPGADLLTIRGQGTDRVFETNAFATRLSGLTISGTGIIAAGSLIISSCHFEGNSISGYDGYGGGIRMVSGSAVVDNSTFANNSAYYEGGGIANYDGTLQVIGSTFSNNSAMIGGGILNRGSLIVKDTRFLENRAKNGGGIEDQGTNTFYKNRIIHSTFINNFAEDEGGGLRALTSEAIEDSYFYNNSSVHGGAGIDSNSELRVSESTLEHNIGHGIDSYGGFSMVNSTISGNTGSGVSYYASQGGIVSIINSTLWGNNSGISGYGDLSFANTILANNTGGDCSIVGNTLININNLVKDGSCWRGGVNFMTGEPFLGPLADNGGPTLTMALMQISPAIDAGQDSYCPAADQRGMARPQGPHCDIGAYEYELPSATATATDTATPTETATITLTPTYTNTYTVTQTPSKTPTITRTPTKTKIPTNTRTPTRTKVPTKTRRAGR